MNITIIGAGKSGLAAAILAQKDGDKPFLTESASVDQNAHALQQLTDAGIEHEFGEHSPKALSQCDLIVTSPVYHLIPQLSWKPNLEAFQ